MAECGEQRQTQGPPAAGAAAPPPPLYRSPAGEREICRLYDRALAALPYAHEERLVGTSFGTAHVVVCGPADAPPLVVWHGAGAPAPFMLRFFDPLLLDSRPPFRIYCPDLPYHAGSRSQDALLDPATHEHGRWCLEVLQGLGLVGPAAPAGHSPPFHVGTSFGGAVLLDLAVVAPDAIRAAALVVPGGLVPVRTWALTLQLILPSILYRLLPCRWTARLAMAGLGGSEQQGGELEEIVLLSFRHVSRWPPSPGGPHGFAADQLRQFRAPTLVLAAEHDFWCPGQACVDAARRLLPGCRQALVFSGGRHLPGEECKHEATRLAAEFFAGVVAGQAHEQ